MSEQKPENVNEAASAQSELNVKLGLTEYVMRDYAGRCVFCKFFRDAYVPGTQEEGGHWVDNPGWCVRYPPIFVGGDEDSDECDSGKFKQPGVQGGDECGEFAESGRYTPNLMSGAILLRTMAECALSWRPCRAEARLSPGFPGTILYIHTVISNRENRHPNSSSKTGHSLAAVALGPTVGPSA